MDNNNNLAPGFITVDAAVKLIQSDTMENPKVNVGWCAENLVYLAPRHNFTIKLIKKDTNGKIVENGKTQTYLATDYDKAILEKAILDKFRELTARDYNPTQSRRLSTMVSDVEGSANMQGRPIANPDSPINQNGDIDGALL